MSVRELAEYFDISTNTAARILNLLVSEDFLYHKQKSGEALVCFSAFITLKLYTNLNFL